MRPVMMIVPVKDGYVLMPFADRLLLSLEKAEANGVRVANCAQELGELVRATYEKCEAEAHRAESN